MRGTHALCERLQTNGHLEKATYSIPELENSALTIRHCICILSTLRKFFFIALSRFASIVLGTGSLLFLSYLRISLSLFW